MGHLIDENKWSLSRSYFCSLKHDSLPKHLHIDLDRECTVFQKDLYCTKEDYTA